MIKKWLKRFTAAVVCAAVVLSVCLFAADTTSLAVQSDKTEELIRHIADNVKKGVEMIDVSSFRISYTEDLQEIVADSIYYKLPELFCVDQLSFIYSEILRYVKVTYTCTAEEYTTMLAQCVSAADRLLNGIEGNAALGEAEKALLIHDRLALLCEYDPDGIGDSEPGPNARNMYGALVNNVAVCDGYSRAYLYLMNRVGIPCSYCRSETLGHSWNIVTIGGKPYHVDVTFDDVYPDISGRVNHNNFLLSTKALRANEHAADDYSALPSDTTYDNYFWSCSKTAFVLAGDSIYYIDNDSGTLNRYADRKVLRRFDSTWRGYRGSYSRLASDGTYLLYSTAQDVYRYNPNTGETEKIFSPSLPNGFLVYGFILSNGEICCELNDSPLFTASTKQQYTRRVAYTAHTHSFAESITPPGCETNGYRIMYCACGYAYSEVSSPPTGHTRVADAGVAPSCTGSGLKEGSRCAVCGKVFAAPKAIPALGHKMTLQMTAPSCTSAGSVSFHCDRCGFAYTELPSETSHHTVGEPYLDENDATVRMCSVCGATVAIPGDTLPYTRCDVDGDGYITEADANYTLQASLHLLDLVPGSREFLAADMDGDGILTATDARLILSTAISTAA